MHILRPWAVKKETGTNGEQVGTDEETNVLNQPNGGWRRKLMRAEIERVEFC